MLRLWAPGATPLSEREAANALESWHVFRGEPVSVVAGPFPIFGNALLIALLGDSDTAVRLLPVLVGTAMLAFPYLLRDYLGRWGALASTALLAFSPVLVPFSRSATSYIFVATLTLAVVAFGLRYWEHRSRFDLVATAVALALLLNSGPAAYVQVIALGTFLVLLAASTKWQVPGDEKETPGALQLGSRDLRLACYVFAGVGVLVSTGLLGNIRGLQEGLLGGISGWFRLFSAPSDGRPLSTYFSLLLTYEALTVVFGIAGVVALAFRRTGFQLFLAWWAVIAFLLVSLARDKQPGLALLPLVPLALLAGSFIADLMSSLKEPSFRRTTGLFTVLALPWIYLVTLALGRFTQPYDEVSNYLKGKQWPILGTMAPDALPTVLGVAPVVLLALCLGVWAVRRGVLPTARMFAIAMLAVLVLWTSDNVFTLSYQRAASPLEPIVERPTSRDVRTLVQDVRAAHDSLQMQGKNAEEKTIVAETGLRLPLAWYLRDWPVTYAAQVPAGVAMAIAEVKTAPPQQGSYAAQRYQMTLSWRADKMDLGKWWRWLAYRDAKGQFQNRDVVLYVRRQ